MTLTYFSLTKRWTSVRLVQFIDPFRSQNRVLKINQSTIRRPTKILPLFSFLVNIRKKKKPLPKEEEFYPIHQISANVSPGTKTEHNSHNKCKSKSPKMTRLQKSVVAI